MACMGRDSERAATIYQHKARGADKAIADAIDTHVEDERARTPTRAARPGPLANGTTADQAPGRSKAQRSEIASDLDLVVGADDGNRTRTVSLGICRICSIYTA
jgi:hypothetical protein